jgi:hypothetical protein
MGGPCQKLDPELTKPKWWPTGVQHKEPDHLLKHGVSIAFFPRLLFYKFG